VSWLRRTAHAPSTGELTAVLEGWDGNYGAASKGALGFELLFFHLAQRLVTPARRSAYEAAWGTRALIWDDVLAAPEDARSRGLRVAARKAAADLRRGTDWGSRHRLSLTHPLGLVPLLGRRYRFADLPAAGTSESLMKTAHGLTNRRHSARYGSVARHISDLADLDANYFALLGGQDGWFGSSNFADQVALWQKGEYVSLPLQPESARKSFRHVTVLSPGLRQ
jgi:penicillin G amidase